MARPRPMKGMGIIADPHRGPVKKRGGKRPTRPGWGQALLGRSRRGWSNGGRALTPRAVKKAWGYSRSGNPNALTRSTTDEGRRRMSEAMKAGKVQHFGPSSGGGGWASGGKAVYTSGKFEGIPKAMLRKGRKSIRHAKKKYGKTAKSGPRTGEAVSGAKRSSGGWSLGGALNSKRKGYQSGRTVNPRAKGEEAMKTQRRMKWNNRTTPVPAGWGAYGSPFSSNARFPSPPGGWNRGGPAKFRDDQSLGIRGGKVRKPVGYQGGGTSGYSDAYLQGQGVDPAMYRKANRKLMKQKRQNILSGKSVRTPAPKRKRISTKKGGGG